MVTAMFGDGVIVRMTGSFPCERVIGANRPDPGLHAGACPRPAREPVKVSPAGGERRERLDGIEAGRTLTWREGRGSGPQRSRDGRDRAGAAWAVPRGGVVRAARDVRATRGS